MLLWLCSFILSGVVSPLSSSSILGTYWPGELIFQWPILLPFHTHGALRHKYWSVLPFPSPVDHILSQLSTMTIPLGWPYFAWLIVSLIQTRLWSMRLDWLVFCDRGFSLSALWWRRIRGLWELSDGRDWLRGKLGLVQMGRAMLSKSLIQFSIDGWSNVPSLLFSWAKLRWPHTNTCEKRSKKQRRKGKI